MSDSQQFSAGDALGKAQDYAEQHGDQVDGVLDKANEAISQATGGKFDGALDQAEQALEEKLGIDTGEEQTGSAPQEGVGQQADTAPPVEPADPAQDPSDPSAPADPSAPGEPGIPTTPSEEPSVQPSGEPGTSIPAEPATEPATEPGFGDQATEGSLDPTQGAEEGQQQLG